MKVCCYCGGSIAEKLPQNADVESNQWLLGITKYNLPFCDEDCAAKASYTIADLLAMEDGALNALATDGALAPGDEIAGLRFLVAEQSPLIAEAQAEARELRVRVIELECDLENERRANAVLRGDLAKARGGAK